MVNLVIIAPLSVLAERGWTPGQWEHFAVDTLPHALLRPMAGA